MTAIDLKNLIQRRVEQTEPQNTILEYLKTIDGKKINKTHLDKLSQILGLSCSLEHVGGMTYLVCYLKPETAQEIMQSYEKRFRLFLDWKTKNVVIDINKIKEQNICYFEALEERNKRRTALLADYEQLPDSRHCKIFDKLALEIEKYQSSKKKIEEYLEKYFQDDGSLIKTKIEEK